jgi:hypothetical protein
MGPRPFQANVRFSHRFRYSNGSNNVTTEQITRGNLLNSIIVNLTGGTSNGRIASAVRVKSIEMWTWMNNQGAVADQTVALTWTSNYGPTSEISDSTFSSAVPAHIRTSPPRDSLASFWSSSGSNESEVILLISAPNYSIMDVVLDFVLLDGSTFTATTANNGSAGRVYYSPFDGPNGNGYWQPVSMSAILN